MRPLRIGFLCSEFPPDPHGGIGSFVYDLARGLAARGHLIRVAGFSSKSGVRRDGNLVVYRLERPRIGASKRASAMMERMYLARVFAWLTRKHDLDIVEMPDWKGEGALVTTLLPPHCAAVVRMHGSASALAVLRGGRATFLTEFFELKSLATANYRIAVSHFIERATRLALRGIDSADVVLPNFVDTEVFKPIKGMARDPNLIVYAGRFSKAKGAVALLESARHIFARFPEIRLEIAGLDVHEAQGKLPLRNQLLSMLSRDDAARVKFLGPLARSEMPSFYSRASCLLLPAREEAFGLAALEAMACGCIPIVVRESGPAEFLQHQETGLIASQPSPKALSAQVAWLLKHEDALKSIRKRAREQVCESFSIDAVIDRNEDFYSSILPTRPQFRSEF